ncbi:hypothetical protein Tco_0653725 [Tanacetum coccineum]|uniref:Uncharacterized protein n=1 Tax=Tanacetum coccineum TaxID=301880 RepID=A0ABQ4X167_9ASTR
MHMLTKPQKFYDEIHKTTLGYQNPLYLRQAQWKQPVLYNAKVLIDKHNPVYVCDSEETLILAEESRLKMIEKQTEINAKPIDYYKLNNLYEYFVPRKQLSAEQLYWSSTPSLSESVSNPNNVYPKKTPINQSDTLKSLKWKKSYENEKWAPATSYRKNNKPYIDASRKIVVNDTHKHAVKQNTQKTDNTLFPSTRRVSYTDASRSKPRSNTKNDRIPQPSSRSKKNKVEAQLRKFKSSSNKNNQVSDCNANIKNVALSNNFENVCLSCNECLFSANHDAYVVKYLKDM